MLCFLFAVVSLVYHKQFRYIHHIFYTTIKQNKLELDLGLSEAIKASTESNNSENVKTEVRGVLSSCLNNNMFHVTKLV